MDDAAGSYNVASHLPVDSVVTVATIAIHLVHACRSLPNGLLQGKHLYCTLNVSSFLVVNRVAIQLSRDCRLRFEYFTCFPRVSSADWRYGYVT